MNVFGLFLNDFRPVLRGDQMIASKVTFSNGKTCPLTDRPPGKLFLVAVIRLKCGENRNHGKFKIYFLMVEL